VGRKAVEKYCMVVPSFETLRNLGIAGLKIIMVLREKRECSVNELIRNARTGGRVLYRVLPVLRKYGLIEEKWVFDRRIISLTKKGEKVARVICKLVETIAE